MPNRIQGLRGLKGLSSLSPEEQASFMSAHADTLNVYRNPRQRQQAANALYMNQKFINTFGIDKFNQMNDGTEESFNLRNEGLFDYKVKEAYQQRFGKFGTNPYNDQVASQLDAQGMYDLLQNEEYIGPYKRKKMYDANLKAAQKVGKTFNKSIDNPYVDALGAGFMQWGKVSAALTPQQLDDNYKKRDKEILDKLYAETQKRREADIQGDADMIYANILDADDAGQKSLAQSYREFDKFATKNSPHYATFKNSKWMKDYSDEDKLKDYAKYLALKHKYGEGIALNYFERGMQNKIAEAQDGKWTGNTLKGVLTTTWSDLGSNVATLANIDSMLSPEKMAIINQGKDPNKPIYDKKGNIVDYKKNDNIWTNPAYWNNVYTYNTFSPTEIKAIEERGGISQDVNVREFGYTPDFLSWDTLEEGFKQGGHVIAGIIETGLTGGIGKGVGLTGKTAMKAMGLSAKAIQAATKAGIITNDILVGATTGLEGAQLEAMGTFNDQLQTAREKIQGQITKELGDYQRAINYNSKAVRLGIDNIYRQLKAQDAKRVALGNREGARAFPMSDATLREQAKQLYTNQLLGAKQKELEELHRKDELEAAKAAAKAYGTNFLMDYVKNIPLTVGIQKYKIAKGSMRSTLDNTINKNIIADLETGGVKRAVDKAGNALPRYASAKKLGKEVAKQLTAGFMDEYLDGLNASFASGVGNNEFDNYIKRNYDPRAYNSTVDTFLGSMLSGLSEGIDGITDRQNLYEGFIGMVSPAATATVNVNAVFRPKDTWRAVVKGMDAYGNKIGKAERMSSILMNPLLNTVTEAKEKDRTIDRTIDAINAVVSANKDKLQDASRVISVLGNYDGTLQAVGENGSSLLDAKDNKLYNAFTLIDVLNGLENISGGTNSKIYKDTMETIDGLAKNNLSKAQLDHEIDRFLADENNKSILEEAGNDDSEENKEAVRQEVAKRLQANAKYFMDMKNKVSDIESTFNHSSSLKDVDPRVKALLAYNIIASDDYRKRLSTLEEELGIGNTDTDTLYKPNFALRYYTQQSRNRAVEARERMIGKIQKEIEENQKESDKVKKDLDASREELKSNSYGDKSDALRDKVEKQRNALEALKLNHDKLMEDKRRLSEEKEEIAKINESPAIDENTILNADARDRAAILAPENRDHYSPGVQAIIDNISNSLKQKDPEALTKIKDAATLAQRIEDMRNVYSKIMSNDKLASAYLDTVERARTQAAMADSLQKDIDKYYTKLDDAYANRENDPEAFKYEVINRSPELIEAYMEDNPEKAEAFKPYHEMLKFDMDAGALINESGYTEEVKKAMRKTLLNMNLQANSREELEKNLEGIIDSPDVDEATKERFENLMSQMQQIGYQRDATVLESRKARKEREAKEAEERKKKEEEQKKAMEESKAAAEKKAEETKAKTSSEDKVASNDNLNSIDDVPMDLGDEKEATADAKDSKDNVPMKEEEKPANENLRIDYGDNPYNITSNDYDILPETAKHKENANFEVHSAEKVDGDWYFIGNFAGSKEQTKVKSKMNADMDRLYKEQQEESPVVKEESAPEDSLIYNNVENSSPSIEKQYENATANGEDNVHISETNDDSDTANDTGEFSINNAPTTLTANSMSLYEPSPLRNDGILVRKKGEEEGDGMNNYFAWMRAAGFKLQNVIDQELARILNKNPHAKVKFMAVKPERNATNDYDMFEKLMLVLDYDDSINKGITSVHDDSNGCVIESLGKKYLIIGVAGYGNNNLDKRSLYFLLWSPQVKDGFRLKSQRYKFFEEHPSERFYVNESLSTEIPPRSLIPGYIVRQMENDREPKFRSVIELVNDKERNPLGIKLDHLAWGIQKVSKFLTINAKPEDVMIPRNPMANSGRAFVLIPASNGKMVPSYLRPLRYTEMNEGALKTRVDKLLQDVVSPNPSVGNAACKALFSIFYLDSETGDNIWRNDDGNEVYLYHNGERYKTFVLNGDFDRGAFTQAIEELNPRINITAKVLSNIDNLREYDEAGALMTDAALLSTAGSSYSVYGLDGDGNMIIPNAPVNETVRKAADSDFKGNQSQVVFNHQYYREDGGVFSLNGNTVTDEKLLEQLRINKRIIDGGLVPAATQKTLDYFILDSGEHPLVVKVDQNSKKVQKLPEDKARTFIEKINEKKAKELREKEADKALKDESIATLNSVEDVDIPGNDAFEMDSQTGEMVQTKGSDVQESQETKDEVPIKDKKGNDFANDSVENLGTPEQQKPTQRFVELLRGKKYQMRIRKILKDKWGVASSKSSELEKLLRDNDIEVDAIGTSKEDIEAWIKTIEDCR